FFFFSSRRRHTRSYGDWSSDVCSSDLDHRPVHDAEPEWRAAARGLSHDLEARKFRVEGRVLDVSVVIVARSYTVLTGHVAMGARSEERRVGKECRSRGGEEE